MASLRLTGYPEGKMIQAVKGVRAATGLGLKEAKDAVDAVTRDGFYELESGFGYSFNDTFLRILDEHGVTYEFKRNQTALRDHIDFLTRFPRDMNVGTLLDALAATQRMVDEGGLLVQSVSS